MKSCIGAEYGRNEKKGKYHHRRQQQSSTYLVPPFFAFWRYGGRGKCSTKILSLKTDSKQVKENGIYGIYGSKGGRDVNKEEEKTFLRLRPRNAVLAAG